MNQYGQRALDHSRQHRPVAYSQIPDPETFFDAIGGLLWQRSLGASASERGHAVANTSDGGFIVAGTVEDKVEMSPRSSVMAISGW